jgi:methyltransferase (TIGR00027 family)
MPRGTEAHEPVKGESKPVYHTGREPSFTAMWHACLRNTHATSHVSPIFVDTRSVQLVPADVCQRVQSLMDTFSPETADAIVFMSVIRHRVLAERLSAAYERGFRQLVVLGAGLDTTAFALAEQGNNWRVFEVDHPATQDWKRAQIANVGWQMPSNLMFAACDFETQDLLSALGAAGFQHAHPAIVSMFGVILYLTVDATSTTLRQLAGLAPQSEVTISYCPPPDGTDPAATETFAKASPTVDATGESFIGYYRDFELERLAREAGFSDVSHHPLPALNAAYFDSRPDGLRLHSIEQLLTATV